MTKQVLYRPLDGVVTGVLALTNIDIGNEQAGERGWQGVLLKAVCIFDLSADFVAMNGFRHVPFGYRHHYLVIRSLGMREIMNFDRVPTLRSPLIKKRFNPLFTRQPLIFFQCKPPAVQMFIDD